MPYAIIRTGGKQYRVQEGDRLRVEKLTADVGAEVSLSELVALDKGQGLDVAADKLAGLAVKAAVLRHGRGDKIVIWNFKRRKGYQRRMGHRQDFTEIKITALPA